MAEFDAFDQEPDGGRADDARPAADEDLWDPFDDSADRQPASERVPPGYERFESSRAEDARDLQRRVRFAMVVLCAVRAATFALGLARLATADALASNFSGLQGWGLVLLVTVLYGLAAVGYSQQEGWARIMSVVADAVIILVIADLVSESRNIDGVLLVILQSVLMPTVSILLAAKAGSGLRRPKVDDWHTDW